MAEEIGSLAVRVGLDTVQFNQGVKELSQRMSILGQEFRNASAGLDRVGDAAEISRLNITRLTGQISEQRRITDQLRTAHTRAAEQYGETSRQAQAYQLRLLRAEGTLQSMETRLSSTTRELAIQSSRWTALGNAMRSASDRMRTIGAGMKNVGQTLAMSVTAPILAAGVASAKLASDLSENMNKVDVAFGKNAQGVKSWSNTTLKSFGISQGSALEMASLFGDMASGMDINTEQAGKMSTKMVGLAGDLASFKNIGLDQASDALKGIFTGEGESLKSLGVIMLDSTLAAFALDTGQKTLYKDMDQGQKVMLRYEYVLSKTKNSQGDFARTSEGTANQARIFGETLKELGANMGQYILPVVTPLIAKLSEMAQAFGKLDESTKKTILVIAGIAAVIGPLLIVGGAMVTGFGAIAGAVGTVSGALAILTTGAPAAAAGVAGVSAASGTLAGILTTLTGPIGLAVLGVVGLVAGGALLVRKLKQEVIPATDLFGNSVSDTTKKSVTAYMDLDKKVGVSLLSFKANNTTITKEIATDMVGTFEKMGTDIKAGRDKHYAEDLANLTKFYNDQGLLESVEAQDALSRMKNEHAVRESEVDKFEKDVAAIVAKAAAEKRTLTQKEEDAIAAIKARMAKMAIKALTNSEKEQADILTRMRLQAKDITTKQAGEVIANSAKQRDETTKLANDQYEKVVASITRQRNEGVITSDDQAKKMIDAAERQRIASIGKAKDTHEKVVYELEKQNEDVANQINKQDGTVKNNWDNLKSWFENNPIIRWIRTQSTGASSGSITGGIGNIDKNARGTNNWRGGLTWVGEEGPELINLQRGAQVFSNPESMAMVNRLNSLGSTINRTSPNVTNTDNSSSTANQYAINVAQLIVREEADITKISQQLFSLQQGRTRGRAVMA